MRTPSLLALFWSALGVATAAAQLPPLSPGSRIRVTHTAHACPSDSCPGRSERVVGSLVAARADSLILTTTWGSLAALPISSITRIERPGGEPWAPVAYAGAGGAMGAGMGAVIWLPASLWNVAACVPESSWFCRGHRASLTSYMAKGAAAGAALGLVMGLIEHAAARSRWVNVFTAAPGAESRVALVPTAAPGSLGFVGRVTF